MQKVEWHHTSNRFNRTDFYSIDELAFDDITIDELKMLALPVKREKKIIEKPLYVTALVSYNYWTGSQKHPHCEVVEEVVQYMSTDKMVSTYNGNKRFTSLYVIKKIEQKTKFADKSRLK